MSKYVIKGKPDILGFDLSLINDAPNTGQRQHFSAVISGTINSLSDDSVQALKEISKLFMQSQSLDEKSIRALRIIALTAKSIHCLKGNGLIAFSTTSYSRPGQIMRSRIVNNCDDFEFSDAPENRPYSHDYLDCQGATYKEIARKGIKTETTIAVEHRNRLNSPTIQCEFCHGTGSINCSSCDGSGREQYTDGYFASGVERIKTGPCSKCGGTGKIPCPQCGGTGQNVIYSEQYSIVTFAEVLNSQRADIFSALPGLGLKHICGTQLALNADYTSNDYDNYRLLCNVGDTVNRHGNIAFLKVSRKEYKEDNHIAIKEELKGFGLEKEYETFCEKMSLMAVEERGQVVCRKELVYVFPAIRFEVVYGNYGSMANVLIVEDADNLILQVDSWINS